VIVADGECQLERQRRMRPATAKKLAAGERVVRVKLWRGRGHLHGRPLLHPAVGLPDAHRQGQLERSAAHRPVATVIDGCVGCGLCGENAHAATLCPSFYRAEVIQNPSFLDRALAALRRLVVPA
jgi:indolepyruvate ferredoxin oxidoreductase, alpha subunit